MDHNGPEHHFDEVECPGCGEFFEFGKGKPTSNNTCSNCGFDMRPYRGQTNKELQPEIYERNTPLDGGSEDRGGNPTQTGILAPTTSSFDPLEHIELEEKGDDGIVCPTCNVGKLEEINGTNGPHYKCKGCNNRFCSEEIHPDSDAVDPKGLGEIDPYMDRMPEDLDPETQKGWRTIDTNPVKRDEWTASAKESNNIPVEHLDLEWVVVDIVEPDSEITEAQEKFTIYIPNGITDPLDEALKQLNVWVENPEENGKLRPYREYSDVIRPKINSGEIQIGVEDPHMADIINHVARTNDLSPVEKTGAAAGAAIPEVVGLGAEALVPVAEAVSPEAGAALADAGGSLTGFAGDLMSGIGNLASKGADKLAGGIGGMLKGIPGFAKKYMQLKGAESILDPALGIGGNGIGGNDGGDSSAALQSGLVDLSSPEFASTTASTYVGTYGDELQTPDSISRRVDTEDPEHVDPHELNDGDNDNINKYDPSNNGMGQGRSPRGEDKTQPDISTSPAMERFLMTLPLIMHYYHSGESVEDDPMIEALHNALENEFPGYLEDEIPDDENPLIEFVKNNKSMPKEAAAAPMTMMPQTPHNKPMEIPAEVSSSQGKDMRGHTTQTCNIADCPQCREMGAPANDPQRGGIPSTQVSLTQPGVYNPSTMPPIPPPQQQQQQQKQGSDHQGPHTKEQVIAVGELLQEEGRGDEILDMIRNPNEFAEEMAQIQGVQSPAEDVSFDAQTAAPPMPAQTAPPANQGMPVPAPKTPGQAAGGGGGMQMGASMLKAAYRYSSDSIAGKCPKCESHSTKMINQDGKCKCHTCGHTWKDKHFEKADGNSTDTSTTSHVYANETLSWKDTNDQPLVENERYMMNRSTGDAIGDEIRIKSITPNDITIILNENSSRAIEETVPLEEIHLDGLTFSPVNGEFGDNNPGIEENADGKPLPEAGSDHTDLSTPHREVGASTKTAGKHYTPMEQRELIDEVGEARNADKLNLEGTHYAEAEDDYFLFGC